MTKKKKRLLLILLALYLAGYPVVRSMNLVVHAATFATNLGGEVVINGHYMRPGDAGIPMLQPLGWITVLLASLVYLPVMPFETFCWSIVHPSGSPFPYPLPSGERAP